MSDGYCELLLSVFVLLVGIPTPQNTTVPVHTTSFTPSQHGFSQVPADVFLHRFPAVTSDVCPNSEYMTTRQGTSYHFPNASLKTSPMQASNKTISPFPDAKLKRSSTRASNKKNSPLVLQSGMFMPLTYTPAGSNRTLGSVTVVNATGANVSKNSNKYVESVAAFDVLMTSVANSSDQYVVSMAAFDVPMTSVGNNTNGSDVSATEDNTVPVPAQNTTENATVSNSTAPVSAQNTTENTTVDNSTVSADAKNTTENTTADNTTIPVDMDNTETNPSDPVPEPVSETIEIIPTPQSDTSKTMLHVPFPPPSSVNNSNHLPAVHKTTAEPNSHYGGVLVIISFLVTYLYNGLSRAQRIRGAARGNRAANGTRGSTHATAATSCAHSVSEGETNPQGLCPMVTWIFVCLKHQNATDMYSGRFSSIWPVMQDWYTSLSRGTRTHLDLSNAAKDFVDNHNRTSGNPNEEQFAHLSEYPNSLPNGHTGTLTRGNTWTIAVFATFYNDPSLALQGVKNEFSELLERVIVSGTDTWIVLTDLPKDIIMDLLPPARKDGIRKAFTNRNIRNLTQLNFHKAVLEVSSKKTVVKAAVVVWSGHCVTVSHPDPDQQEKFLIPVAGKVDHMPEKDFVNSVARLASAFPVLVLLAVCNAAGVFPNRLNKPRRETTTAQGASRGAQGAAGVTLPVPGQASAGACAFNLTVPGPLSAKPTNAQLEAFGAWGHQFVDTLVELARDPH